MLWIHSPQFDYLLTLTVETGQGERVRKILGGIRHLLIIISEKGKFPASVVEYSLVFPGTLCLVCIFMQTNMTVIYKLYLEGGWGGGLYIILKLICKLSAI